MRKYSLATVLLLVAAIAALTVYIDLTRKVAAVKFEVAALERVAHLLVVDDKNKIAVVSKLISVPDNKHWQVYLPPTRTGESFAICVFRDADYAATRVPPVDAEDVDVFPIPSGTNQLLFTYRGERFRSRNGKELAEKEYGCKSTDVFELNLNDEKLTEIECKNTCFWMFDSTSVQQSADEPFLLSVPEGTPFMLWIQKVRQ